MRLALCLVLLLWLTPLTVARERTSEHEIANQLWLGDRVVIYRGAVFLTADMWRLAQDDRRTTFASRIPPVPAYQVVHDLGWDTPFKSDQPAVPAFELRIVSVGERRRPVFGVVPAAIELPRRFARDVVADAVVFPRRELRAIRGEVEIGLRDDETRFVRFRGVAGVLRSVLPDAQSGVAVPR